MPEPRVVFVTNMSPAHSYESAVRYGAIRPITSGNYPVFKSYRLTEEIARSLAYSTEDDYLLFSGSSFVAGLCAVVWLMMHRECKVLLWDPKQRAYVPRTVKRDEIRVLIERARDQVAAIERGKG
jgi:hypothetical protein